MNPDVSQYGVKDGVARNFAYSKYPGDMPKAPIREREVGVNSLLEVWFPAGDGGQNCSITLSGVYKLTQATIWNRDAYIPEAASIRIFPGDSNQVGLPYTTLRDGEAGVFNDLSWDGDQLLSGTWVIRGRIFRSGGETTSAAMYVACEKLAQGVGL